MNEFNHARGKISLPGDAAGFASAGECALRLLDECTLCLAHAELLAVKIAVRAVISANNNAFVFRAAVLPERAADFCDLAFMLCGSRLIEPSGRGYRPLANERLPDRGEIQLPGNIKCILHCCGAARGLNSESAPDGRDRENPAVNTLAVGIAGTYDPPVGFHRVLVGQWIAHAFFQPCCQGCGFMENCAGGCSKKRSRRRGLIADLNLSGLKVCFPV